MSKSLQLSVYASAVTMLIMIMPSFAPMILISSAVGFAVYQLLQYDMLKDLLEEGVKGVEGKDGEFSFNLKGLRGVYTTAVGHLKNIHQMLTEGKNED